MPTRNVIEIESLSYSYPDGTRALGNLSLAIAEGEKVGVVGPNGAGKSTLLLHLNGILRSNGAARIEVLGQRLSRASLKSIRQKVGLVFQNPDDQLFCPTVFDDVAFGPRNLRYSEREVRDRVRRSLDAVGLHGVEDKSAHHLSLGQKKRASIATVLSMDAEILALDEPTTSLDPKGRRDIIELLGEIGGTQVIVTHDLELVRELCDRVIVLFEGRQVAEGRPGELLGDTEFLRRYGLA